ncbi:MAG: [FeFe] hydrogenase, group A [Oscillospiraceae bacterium]|jgi:NADP-reducing hydrogenase subunit HndD|nr:[FeFe] hydrogenase, group A [Oscillospiraceae bacterium]
MSDVNVKVNGIPVSVPAGTTVLDAAAAVGIEIPTLCYMKEINAIGACRICVAEIKGRAGLVASCVYPVAEGMEILTNSETVAKARRTTLELILSNHRTDCLTCARNQNCELQRLSADMGVEDIRFKSDNLQPEIEASTPHLVRDNSKCILCRRCVAVCRVNQGVSVIGPNDRGFATHIGSPYERDLAETGCVSCGQCVAVCPTGALTDNDETGRVWEAIKDPKKHVVVGTAPSVRVTLGECFGNPPGLNVEGKMVTALRRIGFDRVFDVDVSADLTIMEEGTEFLHRVENGGVLPLITSCSPGWIRFCEQFYPEFIPNLSSCKSPQQMFGAMMKTYYAEKSGVAPEDIFVVCIMPCTAKKFENRRDFQSAVEGLADVDVSLTTRELARMINRAGLKFNSLPDEEFDPAFGVSTGAGLIFGATGGVMEAALRTVSEIVTGREAKSLEFHDVRGVKGIKEASYNLDGKTVNVAVCSGLANARALLESVKSGEKKYDFIEIMGCPGGCVNGGGQPIQPQSVRNSTDLRAVRAAALYGTDKEMPLRKSHENPLIKELYATYLEKPGSHKAHKLLHTKYKARAKYAV